MIHYGRPGTVKNAPQAPQNREVHTAAGRILALGCAMIAGFLITMTVPWQTDADTDSLQNGMNHAEGAAAVMSTALQEKETLTRPEKTEPENAAGTGAEPFGYLGGEWNLWEYIGDLMWSLFS